MVVTLTTAAKNWLAMNAGTGSCFAPSGVSYLDAEGISHTGNTGDVVNAFFTAHLVGLDAAIIIASTNYIGFKTINGGTDIGFDDVNFAYTNDGEPITEPTYCAPPAHIISTALTTSVSACAEPCTVDATVTWTNDGVLTGTFTPGITIDGGIPRTAPPESLAAGAFISSTFTISGLTIAGSPHNICAIPGTHCQLVYTVATVDICNWIISRGGWGVLRVYDIMQMVAAYLGQINLGFTVTVAYIMGAVAYYLGRVTNGNTLTGCTFT